MSIKIRKKAQTFFMAKYIARVQKKYLQTETFLL